MPAPVLTLQAERFSPTGSMAGEGVKKLLGTPTLSLMQTVIRESVQNSWDARISDDGIEFNVRLRTLTNDEREALARCIFAELPLSPASLDPLQEFLSRPDPVVLELSDWKTRGLGGPTRADAVPPDGESPDFVNFIRNIGVARDTDQGGGTYGYGKSALYSASNCSAILVDSLAAGETTVRRFIGCHVGRQFDDAFHGRFTGRHWWGEPADESGLVEPATGEAAAELASAIGMPSRDHGSTGTTIMILDPKLRENDPRITVGEIEEALLWYFWPKMVVSDDKEPPIQFRLKLEDTEVSLPAPEYFPPLDLFVEAYRMLKADATGSRAIRCGNPKKLLGKCVIRQGFRGDRKPIAPPEISVIPHSSAHIAVMRPVELVVRYLSGTPLPSSDHEWAGVFICDADKEVEQAFSDSEPPAHDDWIPDQLPDGRAKTFVRVARRELEKVASFYAYPGLGAATGAAEQPSLARVADILGSSLPEFGDTTSGRGSTVGKGVKKTGKASEPAFAALVEGTTGREGLFSVDASNNGQSDLHLVGMPVPVLDGVPAATREEDDPSMPFLGWETEDGQQLSPSDVLSLPPGFDATVIARVGLPEDAAVALRVALREGAPA